MTEMDISEYALTAPFNITTATFANFEFSVAGQDTEPEGMAFSNDGAKMFVVGNWKCHIRIRPDHPL